jgi:hypothetical protein
MDKACLTWHHAAENELRERVHMIQDRKYELRNLTLDAVLASACAASGTRALCAAHGQPLSHGCFQVRQAVHPRPQHPLAAHDLRAARRVNHTAPLAHLNKICAHLDEPTIAGVDYL